MGFRIESEHKLDSDWLPADAFTKIYSDTPMAVAVAIEGVEDPSEQEVRVVDVDTGEVVFRTTDEEYE